VADVVAADDAAEQHDMGLRTLCELQWCGRWHWLHPMAASVLNKSRRGVIQINLLKSQKINLGIEAASMPNHY
jgi:hypothetical protein